MTPDRLLPYIVPPGTRCKIRRDDGTGWRVYTTRDYLQFASPADSREYSMVFRMADGSLLRVNTRRVIILAKRHSTSPDASAADGGIPTVQGGDNARMSVERIVEGQQ